MRDSVNGPGRESRSNNFWGRRAIRVVIVPLLLLASLWPAQGFATADLYDDTTFQRPVGPGAIGASGSIILDHAARRGYQISILDTPVLVEFDLDSLSVLRSREIPEVSVAQADRSTEWLWALDPAGRRLYALADDRALGLETSSLVWFDLVAFAVTEPVPLWPNAERSPLAIHFHPDSGHLYLLTQAIGDPLGLTLRVEERSAEGALLGTHTLPSCFGAQDAEYAPTLARSVNDPRFIFLNCYGSNRIQSQVVRIDLGTDGLLADSDVEDLYPALPGPLSTIFDPGSDRMFFLTANGGAGRGAWVFDGARGSFVGIIATGDTESGYDYAIGVDPTTGRIYMQTPAGFVVADARRTPLPAGLLFRDLAESGYGKIQVDPVRGRLFAADSSSKDEVGLPNRFRVLKDEVPLSLDPAVSDPDLLTEDVAESAGVTDINISASASAFALRTLTTGGVQRAIWNVALPDYEPEVLPDAHDALMSIPLDPGNRDLRLAVVKRVNLIGGDTDATAIFAEVDAATTADLKSRDQTWPFEPMSCRDTDDKAASSRSPLASTSCDSKAGSVWASAATDGVEQLDEGVVLRGSVATSWIYGDPARGIVARSEAVVRGISLTSSVRIGELRTVAETWARGRRGSAGASFDRKFVDVSIDSNGDGKADYVCKECDAKATAIQISKALAGKAVVAFPEPDGAFSAGSPGGYQAIIEKEKFQGYSESSLNDDDSPEVAGMEVIFYADASAGRSRQIVQIAGVQAESRYGIYLLPTASSSRRDEVRSDVVERVIERVPAPAGPPTAPPSLPVTPKEIIDRFVTRVAQGWRVFVAKPQDALLMGTILSFLLLPLYLVSRRKELGR